MRRGGPIEPGGIGGGRGSAVAGRLGGFLVGAEIKPPPQIAISRCFGEPHQDLPPRISAEGAALTEALLRMADLSKGHSDRKTPQPRRSGSP